MATNRHRLILAQQKARQLATLPPLPEDQGAPKLTAEQRKAIYAPKAATSAPQQLQGAQWVNAWQDTQTKKPRMVRAAKTTAKTSGVIVAMISAISAGILLGESKRGINT